MNKVHKEIKNLCLPFTDMIKRRGCIIGGNVKGHWLFGLEELKI